MLTFLLVIFAIYVAFSFIRVMVWGGNIFLPDFERIDDKVREKCGFANWNTPFGKIVYYIFLFGFLVAIIAAIHWVVMSSQINF